MRGMRLTARGERVAGLAYLALVVAGLSLAAHLAGGPW